MNKLEYRELARISACLRELSKSIDGLRARHDKEHKKWLKSPSDKRGR